MDKLLAAERENSGLRKKIDGIVKLNDKLTSGLACMGSAWDLHGICMG